MGTRCDKAQQGSESPTRAEPLQVLIQEQLCLESVLKQWKKQYQSQIEKSSDAIKHNTEKKNSKRNENVSYNKNSTQIGLLKNTGIGIAEETSGNTEHKN